MLGMERSSQQVEGKEGQEELRAVLDRSTSASRELAERTLDACSTAMHVYSNGW